MTILDNDKIIKDFIINNLETNSYYENLKHMYDFADDKDYFVNAILTCFKMYDEYYSIYTIMDSIEDYIEDTQQHDDIYVVIYDNNFMLKDRW